MTKHENNFDEWNVTEEAAKLHADALVVDLTLPWIPEAEIREKESALDRFEASGFDFLSLSIGVERMSLAQTMHYLLDTRDGFLARPDRFVFAESVADIRKAKADGKVAIGFHFQGSEMLERDVRMVKVFYDLGVRHMLLAKDNRTQAADGCYEPADSGLSTYGRSLVREMNRVGMILDLTHMGHRSTMEAMEISTEPVIFSHSNPFGIRQQRRCIKDDQIKGCAESGGVVGIVGFGHFMKNYDISPSCFFENIDYVAQLVGPKHVALGLDYVFFPQRFLEDVRSNPGAWPAEYMQNMQGFNYMPPEDLPKVTEIMLRHGYSDDDVRGVLGENFLRVAEKVWK